MYLDPGAWGLAVQAFVGFLVAIPVLVGVYWKQVLMFFMRGRNAKGK